MLLVAFAVIVAVVKLVNCGLMLNICANVLMLSGVSCTWMMLVVLVLMFASWMSIFRMGCVVLMVMLMV